MEELLIEISRRIWRYSPLFDKLVSIVQRNAMSELQEHFGEGITLEILFEYIPIIKEYLEEQENDYLNYQNYLDIQHNDEEIVIKPNIQYEENNTFRFTEECIICYETQSDLYLNCKHEFCGKCIKTYIAMHNVPSCPKCRAEITHIISNSESSLH